MQQDNVLSHGSNDLLLILLPEVKPHPLRVQLQQILVLERRCGLETLWRLFTAPVNHGSFQIEDTFNLTAVGHSVSHNDQLDRLLIFHLDCVDSVNSCEKALRRLGYSLEVAFHDSLHGVEIRFSHCFDDEFLVFREEKERS